MFFLLPFKLEEGDTETLAAQNEDDPGEFLASRTTEQTSLIRLMSSTRKARGGGVTQRK